MTLAQMKSEVPKYGASSREPASSLPSTVIPETKTKKWSMKNRGQWICLYQCLQIVVLPSGAMAATIETAEEQITQRVLRSIEGTADPRMKHVFGSLVRHM